MMMAKRGKQDAGGDNAPIGSIGGKPAARSRREKHATAPELEVHHLAALIPEMSAEDYEVLRASIKQHGVTEAIALYQGKILDGRHRYRAAKEAGEICPHYVPELTNDDEARAFVIRMNYHRRHLTGTQKREAIANLLRANPKASDNAIAKMLGVHNETVASVRADPRYGIRKEEKRTDTKGRKQPAKKPSKKSKQQPETPKADTTVESAEAPAPESAAEQIEPSATESSAGELAAVPNADGSSPSISPTEDAATPHEPPEQIFQRRLADLFAVADELRESDLALRQVVEAIPSEKWVDFVKCERATHQLITALHREVEYRLHVEEARGEFCRDR
jgi:ParB-like chromosome segregation protein Spo0J